MKPQKIKVTKRNPFVSLALFKPAGRHGKTNKALRQQDRIKHLSYESE
jgi:hypothetical protein